MANRYWIGDTGNWHDTSNWSTSSGGSGGASIPTSSNNVYFDANSFSSAGQTVTIRSSDGDAYANNFDMSAVTNSPTLSFSAPTSTSRLLLSGSLTIPSSVTVTSNNPPTCYILMNSSSTRTIDTNGVNLPVKLNFSSGGGTINQTSNLKVSYIYLDNETYNTNDNDLTVGTFTQVAGAVDFGSSDIQLTSTTSVGIIWQINGGTTNASNANITNIHTSNKTFYGGGVTYGSLNHAPSGSRTFTIYNNNTFGTLSTIPDQTIYFGAGSTQTIDNLSAVGTSGNLIKLLSKTSGTAYNLVSNSSSIAGDYLQLQDSHVSGDANWYAGANSTDVSNNSGWNFSKAIYTLSEISTASGGGTATYFKETQEYFFTSTASPGGTGVFLTEYQPIASKDYEYRVFDDNNFVAIWKDEVISDFDYSQAINQNAEPLRISLARSPENRVVMYDYLKDENSNNILDENSDPILLATETANAVGDGTDVELNYNVEVYAFYGGYEELLDESGQQILDENSDPILVPFGNPNGKRVYTGYIADYELTHGQTQKVEIVIVPHATEMDHYVFKDALGDTTVNYNSTDPITMARDAIDDYNSQGGLITYTTTSMPLSGESQSYDFKLQTTREAIDQAIKLLPAGYYHYVNPGENKQYLLNKSGSADHTFYYQKHITELKLRRSITQLVNKGYFTGGDVGTGSYLYKYYEDATSISDYRPGLVRLSDSRVTTADGASLLTNQEIDSFKTPRYRTEIEITDKVYDIETIDLGEMVGFKNFGNFIDALVLQIVNIRKQRHKVVLTLDMIVPSDTKRLYQLKKQLLAEQIREIGDAPS